MPPRLISTPPMCATLVSLAGLEGWTLLWHLFLSSPCRSCSFSYDSFLTRRGTGGHQTRDYQSQNSAKRSTFFHGSERTNRKVGCNSRQLRNDYEKKSCQEKILREMGSSFLVLHGRQLGRA